MSDVVITAAEEYARRCDIDVDRAMLIVTEQQTPLKGTERTLAECIENSFRECSKH